MENGSLVKGWTLLLDFSAYLSRYGEAQKEGYAFDVYASFWAWTDF